MNVRAYLLLNIVDGNSEYVVQMLRRRAGVVLADWLDGSPDVIAMIEAPDRRRLAEKIVALIGYIDGITEDLHLLVTREIELPAGHRNSTPAEKKVGGANTRKRIMKTIKEGDNAYLPKFNRQ